MKSAEWVRRPAKLAGQESRGTISLPNTEAALIVVLLESLSGYADPVLLEGANDMEEVH